MKKYSLFLIVIFLITGSSVSSRLNAQQKSDTDKEKEIKIQMVIEEQKKAMAEQKRAQEDALKALEESHFELQRSFDEIPDDIETIDIRGDIEGDAVTIYGRRGDRTFRFNDPYVFAPAEGNYHMFEYGDNAERTRWEFSKSVKESTFKRDYSFDVEKTAKSVIMSVMGDCKAGEIRIKITMPGGKTYSEILIDESGNLNWRKSFTITETENQDKAGEWKYRIESEKATGFFKISLQTN